MTDNSTRIANLSPEQRERLRQRLKAHSAKSQETTIQPQPRDTAVFPMSFAQQRLWFLEQLEPGTAVYNIPVAVHLVGPLDEQALARSFADLAQRHEALRTCFDTVGGELRQIIQAAPSVLWATADLQYLPEPERVGEARRLATAAAQQPFDLRQEPLWRVTLYRLAETEHLMLLTLHHIIADGWSLGVLFQELSLLYRSHVTGQPTQLPALPIQYGDYAIWQQVTLQGERLAGQLDRWQEEVGQNLPALELPADHPRPPRQSFRGANEVAVLSRELSDALKQLSRQESVTLFMTLLAAFKVLLHRYTGQPDIVVGSPIANRNRREIEGLIGFFLNTLVLRTSLAGEPAFRDVLSRVRETTLAAYSHQDLPFEKLVEVLHPERDLSRHPLFQVMFILQNAPGELPQLPDVQAEAVAIYTNTTKLDLTVSISEAAGSLTVLIEYNTDLFEPETIRRMLGHFRMLLAGIVANPDQAIATLPLLTAAERQQLLVDWNDTRRSLPRDQTLHQLFESQAARTPQATAFIYDGDTLTYEQLNRRANQLAHYLHRLDVGPGTLVGLSINRSLEMVVGLLGILKTGAAYVPLDPAYPPERLAFIIQDTQAPVVVTQQRWSGRLDQPQSHLVCLDSEWDTIANQPIENPEQQGTGLDPAYVLYTSGSTGRPKGVVGHHWGAINRLHWMWERYPFAADEVGCQKTSLNFIDSIWEIFGPLLQGTATLLVPEETAETPEQLVDLLTAYPVKRLWLVPSALRLLLDSSCNLRERCPHLTMWITTGEAIPKSLFDRFQAAMPHSTLYNLYGTSEVWDVTWYPPEAQHKQLPRVPIGRPITNMQTYILDDHLQPVPVGVIGQLYVGGAGLATGYLNRPELTAQKFIANLFAEAAGERLYQTGDLVRYLPDGNIDLLGRTDHQVKIRGYRIELGEIESLLREHSVVQTAAVITRDDLSPELQLVAYVVPNQDRLRASDLRLFLQQRLPRPMVPARFVILDALPLTPSGKIDRRTLPKPDAIRPQQTQQGPTTPLEALLLQAWQDVLKTELLNTHDNFFEMGGHSLLAARLITHLRQTYSITVPLRLLFEAPTIAELAAVVERIHSSASDVHSNQPARAIEGLF